MTEPRRRGGQATEEAPEQETAVVEEPRPTFFVAAHPEQGDRVALWDVDDAHAGGEVLVAAPSGPVEVAETPAVLQALRDGRLVKVPERQATAWHRQHQQDLEEARDRAREHGPLRGLSVIPQNAEGTDKNAELQARLDAMEERLRDTEARLAAACASGPSSEAPPPPKE